MNPIGGMKKSFKTMIFHTSDKDMNAKQYFGIVAIFLITGAGIFYWYGYKPSEIRKTCFSESAGYTNSNATTAMIGKALKYEDCLKRNGLETEQQLIHLNINDNFN